MCLNGSFRILKTHSEMNQLKSAMNIIRIPCEWDAKHCILPFGVGSSRRNSVVNVVDEIFVDFITYILYWNYF